MKYGKSEAKQYARTHMFGTWGASLTPYTPDYKLDETGLRHNVRHCIDNLQIPGMFLNGLMGESFCQTMAERKRQIDIAVDEAKGRMYIMPYTSAQSLEETLELTKYAEDAGADFVIVINPKFYFHAMTPEGVFQWYRYLAERVNIGIALFNQAEHEYLMSPPLIKRIAEIGNIVALKHAGDEPQIMQTRILCADKIVVSTPYESNWLMDLIGKGQQALIASPGAFTLQSQKLKLVNEYVDLALKGEIARAWDAYKRLEVIRRALKNVTPLGKIQATFKYWTQFTGMAGGDGRVRIPQIELTEAEKQAIKTAATGSGLV